MGYLVQPHVVMTAALRGCSDGGNVSTLVKKYDTVLLSQVYPLPCYAGAGVGQSVVFPYSTYPKEFLLSAHGLCMTK